MDFAGAGRQEDVGNHFHLNQPVQLTIQQGIHVPLCSLLWFSWFPPESVAFPRHLKPPWELTEKVEVVRVPPNKKTKPWAEALANLSTALSQLFLTKGYRFGTLPLSSCFSQGCSSSLRARDDDIGGVGWWLWALSNFQELLGQEMPRHMPVLADCRDPARILAQFKVWKMQGFFKALPKLASWMFLSITVWAWAKEQCPEMLWGMVWEIGGVHPH